MARVFLKGVREPVEIANERAAILKEDWLNDRLPDTIDLGDSAVEKSALKGIELGGAKDMEMGEQRKLWAEVQKEQKEFLNKDPKEKTIFWFRQVFMTKYLLRIGYSSVLDNGWEEGSDNYEKFKKHLGKEKMSQLYHLISQWHEENPEEIFPPAEIYSKWLPPEAQAESIDGWKRVDEILKDY